MRSQLFDILFEKVENFNLKLLKLNAIKIMKKKFIFFSKFYRNVKCLAIEYLEEIR